MASKLPAVLPVVALVSKYNGKTMSTSVKSLHVAVKGIFCVAIPFLWKVMSHSAAVSLDSVIGTVRDVSLEVEGDVIM